MQSIIVMLHQRSTRKERITGIKSCPWNSSQKRHPKPYRLMVRGVSHQKRLEELKSMRDTNLISAPEFEQKKKEILDQV